LRNDEDIGEDDGGIDESFVALNRLEGESGGDFGAAAAFEEVVLAFRLMVFRQVTSGYTTSALMIVIDDVCLPWRITHIGGRSTFSPVECQYAVDISAR